MKKPCKIIVETSKHNAFEVGIFGHKYQLFEDSDIYTEGNLAEHDAVKSEISFASAERTQTDTILHEALEGVKHLGQMEIPHDMLSVISLGMATFLKSIGISIRVAT